MTGRWPVYCAACLVGHREPCTGGTSWCECLSDLCLPRGGRVTPYVYPATVIKAHDGDTVTLSIVLPLRASSKKTQDLGFFLYTNNHVVTFQEDVRLYGCNAPELATDAGKAALAYLLTVMPIGTAVTVKTYKPDKYSGRFDAAITLPDGRDLTAVMIAAGQAAPWNGQGPKPVPPTTA